jgi:hypothetical protein
MEFSLRKNPIGKEKAKAGVKNATQKTKKRSPNKPEESISQTKIYSGGT